MRTSGASMRTLPDGTYLVTPDETLKPYPKVLTDRLIHWAQVSPEKTCIAKRDVNGEWRRLTYAQVLESVRSMGQALIDRQLSAERPVAILSENDLEHFLLMMAGQHVGIPTVSLSTAYSLVSRDFGKLRHAFNILTPRLVFVSDQKRYEHAVSAVVGPQVEVVTTKPHPSGRKSTAFADLLAVKATAAVEDAHERIKPDDVAKFLFTSGSTAMPKAVINTHRMICSNQQMIAQVFPFLEDDPPVIVDWMPWNHTFGGNHDIGVTIYNGGTFYIDDGKPGPGSIERTVRNFREISMTVYFGIPSVYQELLPFLRADRELRESFFRRLGLMFYAGAGLSQPVWDAYRELAHRTCGERIIMATGLGATETSPMAIQTTWETDRAGTIGIPVPGVELKLAPRGNKLEACVRGPNVTPGYWRQPELTQKVFDEEGFYCFGDAVRFIDPGDINKGLLFDGRLSEDFKLATGTWVSVGPLRANFLAHFAPFVRDVVLAGIDRDYVAAIIFADTDACRSLCPHLPSTSSPGEVLGNETVHARFQSLLESFADQSTSSSNRIVRAVLAEEPPSLDGGEITDKNSLNQGNVLARRADVVEQLYDSLPSSRIMRITQS
jgi:feruloyl-CoA synthase